MRSRFTAVLSLLTVISTGLIAVGCQGDGSDETIDYTAQAKLNLEYEGKNFLDSGVGEVTVKMYIDGDTTHFYEADGREVDNRYSNINTPESTADIQKWGKSASLFTQSKLESATTIVLTNPTMKEEAPTTDSNDRWLTLVWYATVEDPTLDDFRLLNLEIVQNGYSAVTGMMSTDPFYDLFIAAQTQAQNQQLHIFSPYDTVDPNYYTGEAASLTIKEFNESAADYVGKTVNMTGIVSAYMGVTNVWVESPYEDPDTGEVSIWGANLFTGYDGKAVPLFKVGNEVSFTGHVEEFNGSYNITGLTYSIYAPTDDDVKLISSGNAVPSANQIGTISDLLAGKYNINTTVRLTDEMTVTYGYGGLTYVNKDGTTNANNAMTLFGTNSEGEEVQMYLPDGATVLDEEGHRITTADDFIGRTIDGVEGIVDEYNGVYNIQVLGTSNFDYNQKTSA